MDLDRIKSIIEKAQKEPNLEEYLQEQLTEAVFLEPRYEVSCDTSDRKDEGYKIHIHRDEMGNLIDITFDRIR